jgi:hypothetical protein
MARLHISSRSDFEVLVKSFGFGEDKLLKEKDVRRRKSFALAKDGFQANNFDGIAKLCRSANEVF